MCLKSFNYLKRWTIMLIRLMITETIMVQGEQVHSSDFHLLSFSCTTPLTSQSWSCSNSPLLCSPLWNNQRLPPSCPSCSRGLQQIALCLLPHLWARYQGTSQLGCLISGWRYCILDQYSLMNSSSEQHIDRKYSAKGNAWKCAFWRSDQFFTSK